MEPKVINNNAYYEIKKYQEDGNYISLPFKFSGVEETNRQSEIRKIMNSVEHLNRSDDEVEDVIYDLNEKCNTSKYRITEPFNSAPLNYLIDFDSAKVHINITDEYHGRGESEYNISVEGIVVEGEVADVQIQEVAQFLDSIFNG